MKKQFLILLIINLAFIPCSAFAVRVPGLYEAEVSVEDQEIGSRRQAIKMVMDQVLVKLTGDRNASTRVALMPVIDTAENYVQQYRYLEVTGEDTVLNVKQELKIRIRFDELKLNNALRNLGIQVWGKERPSTLVWLAIEDEYSRRILHPEEDQEIFYTIDLRARSRGIVLINPLFDLQDTSNIRASDIWGGFNYSVKSASERYYPDLILTGKIATPLPDIWEINWTVFLNGSEQTYSTEGSYLESVLNEGINDVADIITSNYAQASMPEVGNIIIKVIDVITLQQYAKVLGYLQSLSPVSEVEVLQVSAGNIEFNIYAHGGEKAILQAINFGRILEPVGDNINIYRLNP
jgi:hypothetical protein